MDGAGTRGIRQSAQMLILGAGGLLIMAACTPSEPGTIPVDEAWASCQELVEPLQTAMHPEGGAEWNSDGGETLWDDGGTCRWAPADSVSDVGIPEDDAQWEMRESTVDEILGAHGFDPVGAAGRRAGAPAYGFDTSREDGARVQLYSAPGTTVIRVSGFPVDPGACNA